MMVDGVCRERYEGTPQGGPLSPLLGNVLLDEVDRELEKRGHDLIVVGDYSGWMGGGQAVLHDSATKVNYGASSPRKDGAAIPEPDPYFRVGPAKRGSR